MIEGLRQKVQVPGRELLHLRIDRRERGRRGVDRAGAARRPAVKRMAVMCYNDVNALGALRAVVTAKRVRIMR